MNRRSGQRKQNQPQHHEEEVEQEEEVVHSPQVAQVVQEDSLEDSVGDQEEDGQEEEVQEGDEYIKEEETETEAITQDGVSFTVRTSDGLESFEGMSSVKIIKVVPLPHARSEVWSYFGFIADDEGEIQDKRKAICKICATTLSYSGNTTNLFTHLKSMHPEAKPQKLAPTNRNPKSGVRRSKRTIYDVLSGSTLSLNPVVTSTATTSVPSTQVVAATPKTIVIRSIPWGSSESDGADGVISNVTEQEAPNGVSETAGGSSNKKTKTCSANDVTNAIVDMLVKDCRPVSLIEGKGFQALLQLLAPNYKVPDSKTLEVLLKKRYENVRQEFIIKGMSGDRELS